MSMLAGVAQLEEQTYRKRQGVGSSPTLGFDVAAWRQAPETWRAAVEGWLAAGSANTQAAYTTALAQFVAYLGCDGSERPLVDEVIDAQLWRVTAADVRMWQRALQAQGLAPATVNSRIAGLSSFFRFCQEQVAYVDQAHEVHKPLLAVNPAATVRRLEAPQSPRVALSVEQARALLRVPNRSTVSGCRTYALLLAYLLTGQRNSEMRTLRWGDIRREGEAVLYRWHGKGKSGEERLHPAVYAAITAYLQAAGRLGTIAPENFIFTPLDADVARRFGYRQVKENQPISRQRVNQIVKATAKRAGLRPELITTHTLRRTAARRFYEASGFDLDETAKILHHGSPTTTRVYLNQPERETGAIWESVAALYGV